jgi:hypothetical protein
MRAEPPDVQVRRVYRGHPRRPIPDARPRAINPGDRRDIWGTPFPQNAPESIVPQPNLQPMP